MIRHHYQHVLDGQRERAVQAVPELDLAPAHPKLKLVKGYLCMPRLYATKKGPQVFHLQPLNLSGRDEWIRTTGLSVPNAAL